jgi:hypothetical protein
MAKRIMYKAKATSATSDRIAGDYVQIVNPAGYLANREITNLPGQFLVRPSINTFIKNAEKVISRNGYTLFGPTKTSSVGCNGGYDWNEISSGGGISLRQNGNILNLLYGSTIIPIFTLPTLKSASFASWWSATEQIDFLIFGNGGTQLFEWSGSVVPIASITASSITKQKYLSGNDISFVNNGLDGQGNVIPGSIVKPSGGLLTIANFQVGDIITPSGSVNNNIPYLVSGVSDTALTIDPNYSVTTEAAGATVVLQLSGGSTWAAARAHTNNAGDANDRAFTINGIKYTYTGGESTGTLTGVSPSPFANPTPIVFGSIATQTVRTYSTVTVQSGTLSNYTIDIVWVVQNQIVLGSKSNRTVYISKQSDFTNYTYTTPLRLPGEGATITLDACPSGFAKGPYTTSLTAPSLFFISAAPSRWYRVSFYQQTQTDALGVTQLYETTPCQAIPTGTNSAAISQDAIIDVKNAEVYISYEQAVDSLQHVTSVVIDAPQTIPFSDPIKDDIEGYNLTGAHGVYHHRTLWITLPAEGRIIAYDYVNGYWQPPQTANFSRLALVKINGVITLCGHAANSNETYILFDGFFNQNKTQIYTDNGATIKAVAAFGYENYGSRFSLKRFSEMATELYIAPATKVHDDCYLDYGGFTHIQNKIIDIVANPSLKFSPVGNSGEGENPEGYAPEGSTTDVIPVLIKCRVVNDVDPNYDFFERQRIFWSDSLGGHFEILAYGEDIQSSENLPTWIHQ